MCDIDRKTEIEMLTHDISSKIAQLIEIGEDSKEMLDLHNAMLKYAGYIGMKFEGEKDGN